MEQTRVSGADPGAAWLKPRRQMAFAPVSAPITGGRAKLGGQPVWRDRHQWPQSAANGEQMMFIGQFPIPGDVQRMAYLFRTDGDKGLTWEADGGENALIVQPGGRVPAFIKTVASATGPTLWKRGPEWNDGPSVERSINFVPIDAEVERWLELAADYCEAERNGLPAQFPEEVTLAPRSYIGGRPVLWQPHLPLPVPDGWHFFFQLDGFDDWDEPAIDFGGGTGYAFLSPDCLEGRFTWDCV
ncbi:hypothetical protein [Myceligenerans salitolerans]|uniref:DUF1963 domain-containing protein n=1 Tax=Myceligenerans salitolerans TaxID=1230528 RepID=A0ABS3I3H9_9MICO|nr:hypothetical protein [Myceligenerans salitolerans]MBO0607556.1 hypothetical protein [Myceligenerans salitolerans]